MDAADKSSGKAGMNEQGLKTSVDVLQTSQDHSG